MSPKRLGKTNPTKWDLSIGIQDNVAKSIQIIQIIIRANIY